MEWWQLKRVNSWGLKQHQHYNQTRDAVGGATAAYYIHSLNNYLTSTDTDTDTEADTEAVTEAEAEAEAVTEAVTDTR